MSRDSAADPHRGLRELDDPVSNKRTAFTEEEPREHWFEGLLPPTVETIERQLERITDLRAQAQRSRALHCHTNSRHDASWVMIPIETRLSFGAGRIKQGNDTLCRTC